MDQFTQTVLHLRSGDVTISLSQTSGSKMINQRARSSLEVLSYGRSFDCVSAHNLIFIHHHLCALHWFDHFHLPPLEVVHTTDRIDRYICCIIRASCIRYIRVSVDLIILFTFDDRPLGMVIYKKTRFYPPMLHLPITTLSPFTAFTALSLSGQ